MALATISKEASELDTLTRAAPFEPIGLPDGVFYAHDAPHSTRVQHVHGNAAAADPSSAHSSSIPIATTASSWASSCLFFALHTVDVIETATTTAPPDEVAALALADAATFDARMTALTETQAEVTAAANADDPGIAAAQRPPPTTVYLTGHTPEGLKIGIITTYMPSCEVELPDGMTREWFEMRIVPGLRWRHARDQPQDMTVVFHRAPRFHGYIPDDTNPLQRKQFWFARCAFRNTTEMRNAAALLRRDWRTTCFGYGATRFEVPKFNVYEDGIDTVQKFVDAHNLQPSGWHTLASPPDPRRVREMLVDIELELPDATRLRPLTAPTTFPTATTPPDPMDVPPLSIAVIDCEMNSRSPARMPRASCPTNPVVAISIVFAYAGTDPQFNLHSTVIVARCGTKYILDSQFIFSTSWTNLITHTLARGAPLFFYGGVAPKPASLHLK